MWFGMVLGDQLVEDRAQGVSIDKMELCYIKKKAIRLRIAKLANTYHIPAPPFPVRRGAVLPSRR
jgi:hypothetical protein